MQVWVIGRERTPRALASIIPAVKRPRVVAVRPLHRRNIDGANLLSRQ